MAMLLRKSAVAVRAAPTVASRRSALVVRASAEGPKPTESTPVEGVEFGAVPQVQPAAAAAAAVPSGTVAPQSFFEAMSFANPVGPEIFNGRLAMLGVFAAVGAELATGESFVTQFESATPIVLGTWLLFTVASLVPLLKGADTKASFGPFTPAAERYNGWAAMVGIAALIIIEGVKGSALF